MRKFTENAVMKNKATAISDTKNLGATETIVGLAIGLSLVLAMASGATEIPVGAPDSVDPAFDNARDVVMTDWDRDGNLDIIAAAFDTGDVTLWLHQGSNWVESSWPLGPGAANALAVGDIDGNGRPDLMYASGNLAGATDRVGVVLNRTSDFPVTVDNSTVTNPQCVALADLDGDGDLDGITCEFGSDQVTWHENLNGNGETWVTHPVTSGIGGPADAVSHDIDLDGDLDLVVATFNRIVWVENRLNETTTTWLSHDVATGLTAAESIVVGDVDGDGEDEIVAGMVNDPLLAWWYRPAVLTSPWTRKVIQSDYGVADLGLHDIDQDGDLDILASKWAAGDGGLRYWQNNGVGTFVEQNLGGSYQNLRATAIGDLDSDGDADFALAGGGSDVVETITNLTVHSSISDLVFGQSKVAGSSLSPLAMAAVDLDLDGDLDILSYDNDQGLRWRDTVEDAGTIFQATGSILNDPKAFELADIDNDGDQDVVMGLGDGLEWLENNGFGFQFSRHTIDSSSLIEDVMVIDLDNDGHLDVIAFNAATSQLRWWRNTGDGAGWFENPIDSSITTYHDMTAADLEGDGALEIIIAADGKVTVYARVVDTVFTQSTIRTIDVTLLLAEDFDGDGDIDLCGHRPYMSPEFGRLYFWANDGSGDGWDEYALDFCREPGTIVAVDIDLDGDLDVVGASLFQSRIATNLNTATHPFPVGGRFLAGGVELNLLVVGDFTNEGFPSLIGRREPGEQLVQIETDRGQYQAHYVAPETSDIYEGSLAFLGTLEIRHLGRPEDQPVEMRQFELDFRSNLSDLTADQINGLFQRVWIERTDPGGGILAEVIDPNEPSPLVLDVVPEAGAELIDAPADELFPSVAHLEIHVELKPGAADVVSEFQIWFSDSSGQIVATDPFGIPLVRMEPIFTSGSFSVNDSGNADLIFADGFEAGHTSAWDGLSP